MLVIRPNRTRPGVAEVLRAAGAATSLTRRERAIPGSGGAVTVNGAPVLCGDVPTENATVLVIGEVLTPPAA